MQRFSDDLKPLRIMMINELCLCHLRQFLLTMQVPLCLTVHMITCPCCPLQLLHTPVELLQIGMEQTTKHKTVLTSASTKGWFQPSIVVESARNGCAVHVVAPNDNLKWSGGAKCAPIRRVLRAKQSFEQETNVPITMNRSNDMDICSSTQLLSLSLLY
jgi:hypothetical protein